MAITLDPPEVATPTPTSSPPRPPKPVARTTGIGWVQWLVAALLVGAGAVHLALAPSHFGESTVEGIGFLVAAWLQIALAVAVLLRPTRAVIFTIIAVSAASIGAWAVSRIWGLPFGEHADHAENVTVVDALTVVMEAFTVVLAATLLSPSVRRFRSPGYAVVAVVAVLGLTSALIAAPEARDHSAAAHGDTHSARAADGGATGRCDAVDTHARRIRVRIERRAGHRPERSRGQGRQGPGRRPRAGARPAARRAHPGGAREPARRGARDRDGVPDRRRRRARRVPPRRWCVRAGCRRALHRSSGAAPSAPSTPRILRR